MPKNNLKLMKSLVLATMLIPSVGYPLADIVYDPKVDETLSSNFVLELTNTGNTVSQLIAEVELIKQELARLGNYDWNTSQDKINELGGIVSKGNTLAYSASNINEKFSATYPGYKPETNYSDHYKDIVNTTQNTLNQILQSIGSNAADFENENSRLKTLQNKVENADGQTKAIQAASQIASAEVEQLQLLRQTMIAQTNAQTAYFAAETQKEASKKAAFDSLLNDSNHNVTGNLNEHPIDNDPFNK